VETLRQDVDQVTADELVGAERHQGVALGAIAAYWL
jgi:hypothetical protein